jgi:uncharacterized protein (TIGR03000 family)
MMSRQWLVRSGLVATACLLAAGPVWAQRSGGGGGSTHAAPSGRGGANGRGFDGRDFDRRGAGYFHYYPGFYPGFYGYGFGYYPWPYGYTYWGNDPGYYPNYNDYAYPDNGPGPFNPLQYPPPTYVPSADRTPTGPASAQVAVHVPAEAKVWFDGQPTTQTGVNRLFESPPVASGREYAYDIRAQWKENGKDIDRTEHIRVYAGAHLVVDLTKPGDGEKVPMPRDADSADK